MKSQVVAVLSVARATGSLAGGFLVAVAGCALVAVACFCWVFEWRLRRNGPPCVTVSPSHLHNGPRPIKRTCTELLGQFGHRQFADRAMMAERQLQEKKSGDKALKCKKKLFGFGFDRNHEIAWV